MKPLVSVITPCYNGEKFVHRILDSILEQTYPNIEFIFVNDGSTDHTGSIVQSYADRFKQAGISFVYIYQENSGLAATVNRGLAVFKGKYVTWPDSDDFLARDSIACKAEFLESNPEYKMVRSNGVFIREDTLKAAGRISNDENRFNEDIFKDLYMGRTYLCCGCYMIEAKTFFELYPDRQIYGSREGQNWQLLLPVASVSKCGYIDKDLYCILLRSGSLYRAHHSFREQMDRIDEHMEILRHALKRSRCDYTECMQSVNEKYARVRLNLALKYHHSDVVKEQYRYLKNNSDITRADKRAYFWGSSKILNFIYELITLPGRGYNRIKRMLKK